MLYENSICGGRKPLIARISRAINKFSHPEGATHVDVCHDNRETLFAMAKSTAAHIENNKRKCAFTLAETLITLGIIGVVAALTLPSVIIIKSGQLLQN